MNQPNIPTETLCDGTANEQHVWRTSNDAYCPISALLTSWQKWATNLSDWRWCVACDRLEYTAPVAKAVT